MSAMTMTGPSYASPRTEVMKHLETQRNWSQALELKLEQACNNMRCELQGSLKLAIEGLTKKVTDQVTNVMIRRQASEKKDHESLITSLRSEQGVALKEFQEHKASIGAHLRRLDHLISHPQKFNDNGSLNGYPGHGSIAKVELQLKRLDEKFRKEIDELVGLKDRVTAISQRSKAENTGLQDLINDVREQGRADFAKLTERVNSIASQGQSDVAELQELVSSINGAQESKHSLAQQTFESLEARLREGVENSEQWTKEISQMKAKVNGMHGEILDLTAAVTAQSKQEIAEKIDKQCKDLQYDVDQSLRRVQTEMRNEFSAYKLNQKHQMVLEKLPTEFEAVKAAFEEQKLNTSKRFSAITGQVDDTSLALREEHRLRNELCQEVSDRLDRKVVNSENRLRGEMQKTMDETSHKQRESMREMQDTLHKLHCDSLARRVNEAQELLEERMVGQMQSLQQKTTRSVEELKTSMDRQKSHVQDHLSQESASREACEERLQNKIENVVALLNADHEALRKKYDSRERQTSVPRRDESTFYWEDEVRRLWEALDGHTHDITTYDKIGSTPPMASQPFAGHTPISQRTSSPPVQTCRRSSSFGSLQSAIGSQNVVRQLRSPRATTMVRHSFK